MKPFDTACLHCGGKMRVTDPRLVGRRVKCPKCSQLFRVEDPAAVPATGPAVAESAQSDVGAVTTSTPTPAPSSAPLAAIGVAEAKGNGQTTRHPMEASPMPNRIPHSEHASSPAPGRGMAGDLRRLKTNSAGVAAELTQFLAQMKNRSPQEVLGAVAQSGLTQGVIAATLGCIVLTAVFTVIPYALAKANPRPVKAVAADTATAAPAPKTETANPPAADPKTGIPAGVPANGKELLDKLGEGETKSTDPKKNPLEAGGDDLLKDLK